MRAGLAAGVAALAAAGLGLVGLAGGPNEGRAPVRAVAPHAPANTAAELVHKTLPLPLARPAGQASAAGDRLTAGPDFVVAVPGGDMTAAQLSGAATVVSTTISGGFNAAITLSVTGLPASVTATFTPATISAPGTGRAFLKLVAGASAPVGTYTLTVMGTAGATVRTATVSFTVAPLATSDVTVYTDGFEGSFPGVWYTRRIGADTWWGSSTYRKYAGAKSVYCASSGSAAAPPGGPYRANMSGWMAYGPFSLVGATAARADFKYWNKSQLNKDYFEFMVSIDGLHFWGFKKSGTSSSAWQSGEFDFDDALLPQSALGQSDVYFAFIFESDGSTQYEGAYVDSLTITKTVGGTACMVTCTATAPAFGAPATYTQFNGTINASSCDGSPTIAWTFGDGTPQANVPSPSHVYAANGTFPWQMTATMGGQTCVKNGTVTISSCTLVCNAAAPASALTGSSVQFNGQVTPIACTTAPAISWTFGDGGGSSALSPMHTYASAGVYPWKMTAAADGRTCETTGSIIVNDPPTCSLSCSATVPEAGSRRAPVQFHASATASNCGGSPAYSWDFGDGAGAATADAAHTYSTLGPKSWTLTVTAGAETCVKSGTVTIQYPVRRHLELPH